MSTRLNIRYHMIVIKPLGEKVGVYPFLQVHPTLVDYYKDKKANIFGTEDHPNLQHTSTLYVEMKKTATWPLAILKSRAKTIKALRQDLQQVAIETHKNGNISKLQAREAPKIQHTRRLVKKQEEKCLA